MFLPTAWNAALFPGGWRCFWLRRLTPRDFVASLGTRVEEKVSLCVDGLTSEQITFSMAREDTNDHAHDDADDDAHDDADDDADDDNNDDARRQRR